MPYFVFQNFGLKKFSESKCPCNHRSSISDTSHWRRMCDFESDRIQEKLLLFLSEGLVLFNCMYTNDGNANLIFISSLLSTWSLCTGFIAIVSQDDVTGENLNRHQHLSLKSSMSPTSIFIFLETHC